MNKREAPRIAGLGSRYGDFYYREGKPDRSARLSDLAIKVRRSPEEKAFAKREKVLNAIDNIPFLGGLLLDTMQKVLKDKRIQNGLLQFLAKGQKDDTINRR